MSVARGAAPLGLLFGLGCIQSQELIRLPWPDSSEARSAILALHRENGLELFAADLNPTRKVYPEAALREDAPVPIELLLYDMPLAELGLEPGLVALDPGGLFVPDTERVWTTGWDGEHFAEWSPGMMSASVRGASIARDPRALCAHFEVERTFDLGAVRNNSFGLVLGPDRALLGSEDGKLLYLDADGGRQVTDFPADLPLVAGAVDPSGALWFTGAMGELWRGALNPLPAPKIEAAWVTTVPRARQLVYLLVEVEPALVVYTISDDGAWERYANGQWELIYDFGELQRSGGGLASPEPGVVYAGVGSRAQILRYEDGRVEDVTPPGLLDGVTAVGRIDGLGAVFAAGQGRIYVQDGPRAFRPLPSSTLELLVFTFASFRGGFLIGGSLGFVAEYRPQSEIYCPAEQLATGTVRALLPLTQGVLVGEDLPISRTKGVSTLLKAR